MKLSAFMLLAASTSSCTSGLLVPGTYAERSGAHAILLEGSTLTIGPDTTFTYAHWSDDLSSGRYGSGTYRLAGRQLQLRFTASAPVAAYAQATPLVARLDSVVFTFAVASSQFVARGQDSLAPVPNAVVTGRDASGRVLLAMSSNPAGRARLAFAHAARPTLLQAECLGLVTWRQACPDASTAYRLRLPPAQGAPYPAGTTKTFRVRRRSARQLVLGQGSYSITLSR